VAGGGQRGSAGRRGVGERVGGKMGGGMNGDD